MAENIYLFFDGLIIGSTIAAIGGPVTILCIRQTIHNGIFTGIAIGAGAASADALFSAIAAFGLTFISNFLIHHQKVMHLSGGLLIIYIGIMTFIEKPKLQKIDEKEKLNLIKYFLSSFIITLTNPATILFFMAISLDIVLQHYLGAAILVMGVFVGSLLWFSLLASIITIFHANIINRISQLNKFLGLGLILFGLLMISKAVNFVKMF